MTGRREMDLDYVTSRDSPCPRPFLDELDLGCFSSPLERAVGYLVGDRVGLTALGVVNAAPGRRFNHRRSLYLAENEDEFEYEVHLG